MGRDDARPIRGLQGGTAPARAFHDFMMVAVARRPVEPFETQVPMPDWQLTPEEEMFGDSSVDQNGLAPLVDANGNPLPIQVPQQPGSPPSMVRPDGTGEPTQQELDQAFPPGTPVPQPQPRQPVTQPPPPAEQRSSPDSPQPRGFAP
jgi:penicillin-binding protein 1A